MQLPPGGNAVEGIVWVCEYRQYGAGRTFCNLKSYEPKGYIG